MAELIKIFCELNEHISDDKFKYAFPINKSSKTVSNEIKSTFKYFILHRLL